MRLAILTGLLLFQVPCTVTNVQQNINATLAASACPLQSGNGELTGKVLTLSGSGLPSAFYFAQGPAPVSTTFTDPLTGVVTSYDAVIYLDSVDGKLKILHSNGTITVIG